MPQGRIPVLAGPVRMRSARSSRVAGGELSRMRSVPGDRALSRPRKVMQTWRDGAWRWFWGVVAPVVVNRPGADWRAPQNPHKPSHPGDGRASVKMATVRVAAGGVAAAA